MPVYHSTVIGVISYLRGLTSEFNLIYSVVKIHTRLMSYDCKTEAHTRSKSVLALTQFLLQLGRQKYDSEP